MYRIHINRAGEEVGIFSPAELKQQLQDGRVLPTDQAWVEGETNWMPVSQLPTEYFKTVAEPPPLPQIQMVAWHCVPAWRFAICSFVTAGFYTMWWTLRCWIYIRVRDQSNIWPFWRMVFAPIWMYFLADDIERHTQARVRRAPMIAALFLFANFAVMLPEPWWLIGLFSFVPLMPLVRHIERFNRAQHGSLIDQPLFHTRHFILCGLFVPYLAGTLLMEFQVLTGTRVLAGKQLLPRNVAFLQDEGLVEQDEAIVYFYSGGLQPLVWRGVILTDKRLIRYWREAATGERVSETVDLSKIARVDVTRPTSGFMETQVKVTAGEKVMEFGLGIDGNRDVEFTKALENYVPRNTPAEAVAEPEDEESPPAKATQ